jgi:hypothetical protein
MRLQMAGEIDKIETGEKNRGANVDGQIAIRQGRTSAQSQPPIEGANACGCEMEPESGRKHGNGF